MNAPIVMTLVVALLQPILQERVKRDDPDHEEMLRMDERARIRERNESMRPPTGKDMTTLELLRRKAFMKDVDGFSAVLDQPKKLRQYAKRIESFLADGLMKPIPRATPVMATPPHERNVLAMKLASELMPLLSQLKNLERQHVMDRF